MRMPISHTWRTVADVNSDRKSTVPAPVIGILSQNTCKSRSLLSSSGLLRNAHAYLAYLADCRRCQLRSEEYSASARDRYLESKYVQKSITLVIVRTPAKCACLSRIPGGLSPMSTQIGRVQCQRP